MSRQAQGTKKEVSGVILNIKAKETAKGEAATYLCQTKSKNKFWFMGWLSPWLSATGDIDLSEFVVGQEITVQGLVNDEGIKKNDDGTMMMFLAPNPKLIRKSPVTAEMQTQKEYRQKLAPLKPERLATAIQEMVRLCGDQLESGDEEFARSLADGSKKYGSVSDKQRPHVIRLCAKYVTKNMTWRKTVDDSLKNNTDMGDGGASDAPQNDPNLGFDDNVNYGADDTPF